MVKLNQTFAQQQTGFSQENNAQFQGSPTQNQPNQSQFTEQPAQKSGLISLPPALMQIVPWIPFALEAMTGQKIPQMGGTIGEIQASLQQIQFHLNQILSSQQQIFARIESLENNASNQLTNLSQQVASTNKSFHLLATETKRSLEFNPRPKPELAQNSYDESEY